MIQHVDVCPVQALEIIASAMFVLANVVAKVASHPMAHVIATLELDHAIVYLELPPPHVVAMPELDHVVV